jgi:propanediol utilization protein
MLANSNRHLHLSRADVPNRFTVSRHKEYISAVR